MADLEARFEEMYRAFSGAIFAYAARRTSDPSDAADIVAETFTIAWRRIGDVPQGGEAKPWLFGVARNLLSKHHRGRRRRGRLTSRLNQEAHRFVAAVTVPEEFREPYRTSIAEAFAQLSDSDRELLKLVGWEDLDRTEIAAMLGCSRTTLRVRLHRARRRFERHLRNAGLERTPHANDGSGMTIATSPAAADSQEAR